MNIEDIKTAFPSTPDSVKQIVSHTVDEQTRYTDLTCHKSPFRLRRAVFVGLAAVLVLALSVTAAAEYIRRFKQELVGKYGMRVELEEADNNASGDESDTDGRVSSMYQLNLGWIPDGSIAESDGYAYTAVKNDAGELLLWTHINDFTEGDSIEVSDVIVRENMIINDHEAIYYEMGNLFTGAAFRTVMMYYPEEHCIVNIMTNAYDKNTVVMVAENAALSHVHGSDYYSVTPDDMDEGRKYTTLNESDMTNIHCVGDSFYAQFIYANGVRTELEAKVTDVQITSDNSLFNDELTSDNVKRLFDEDGNVKHTELRYIRTGDGINTLSKTVFTETAERKVVYITMEITNTTDKTLEDITYYPSIVYLEKTADGYAVPEICLTDTLRTAPNGKQYNEIAEDDRPSLTSIEMIYCKTEGEERNEDHPNRIYDLAPGETAVVHVAYVVIEDMLPNLYLRAGGSFDPVYPTDEGLAEGYVDIRS